jgi:hypothetical protein
MQGGPVVNIFMGDPQNKKEQGIVTQRETCYV